MYLLHVVENRKTWHSVYIVGQTFHDFNIGGDTSLSIFTTVFAESQFEPQVTKSFAHKSE